MRGRGFLFLFLFAFSGCGTKENTSSSPRVPLTDYSQCEFMYEEGGVANTELLQQKHIETLSFGKIFESNIIESVLLSSTEETVHVLETLNISLYKAKGTRCPLFHALAPVEGELLERWNYESSQLNERGRLAGLYIPGETVIRGEIGFRPNIIMREDTSRYSLLHEMMHFLFHKYQMEEGIPNLVLNREIQSKRKEADLVYKAYEELHNSRDYRNYIDVLSDLFVLMHESIKRNELEEAVIEDYLAEAYVKEILAFVPLRELLDNSYLLLNAQSAHRFYADAIEKGRIVETSISDKVMKIKRELVATENQLTQVKEENPTSSEVEALGKKITFLKTDEENFSYSQRSVQNMLQEVQSIIDQIDKIETRSEKRRKTLLQVEVGPYPLSDRYNDEIEYYIGHPVRELKFDLPMNTVEEREL